LIDVDSYGSIKELVERGVGYSILPVNAVVREAQSDRLATWPIIEPELRRRVHLVHPADRPMTKAVAAIEELTREVLLDLVRTGQWGGASALR
jgi:LysR family nitrogen assimilation transcriptional regulator